jgi:phosphoglycolate phosphatase-like HAD superfamily hydrolase
MIEIFDMDGVIIDSFEPHLIFYNEFGKKHGIKITDEIMRNALNSPEDFYGAMGFPGKLWKPLRQNYEKNYRQTSNPFFPGMKNLLQKLKSQNKTICLATSNMRVNVEGMLDETMNLFNRALTRDEAKPKSEALQKIVEEFRLPHSEYRLIGDTFWDRDDAKKVGIGFVGVSWGWCKLQPNSEYPVMQTPTSFMIF